MERGPPRPEPTRSARSSYLSCSRLGVIRAPELLEREIRGGRHAAWLLALSILALGAGSVAFAQDSGSGPVSSTDEVAFQFALIGDLPYGIDPGERHEPFERLVAEINDAHPVQWVLHAGDIKAGSTECSDALFKDRLKRYNAFHKPVVLTPGDNEWTDCHRVEAGEYQPRERLAKLREIFFASPGETIGGVRMDVDTQADVAGFEAFPENVRWTKNGVVFATLHLVGSRNGLAPFDPRSSAVRTPADDSEVERRTEAALAWLNEAFDLAEDTKSAGIFLMIHANPGLERSLAGVDRRGFEAFLAELEQRAVLFGKPVVLAHGDSHYFRVDKPRLVDTVFLPNFTRVETFGSPRVHWIRVTVDPESPEVFGFQQEIVGGDS